MARLIITAGNPVLDGEYELDLGLGFTKTEYFLMKKHVGILVEDLAPGARVDANVLTAWGLVSLHRAGKQHLFPLFMETRDDQTDWIFDEAEVEENDADPPAADAARSESSESDSSGGGTNNGSDDSRATILPLTGTQG